MKKKGMAVEELLKLILILIVSSILFYGVYKTSAIFSERGDVEKCRLTVLANSQVHETVGVTGNLLGYSKQVPIQCPTTSLKIEGKTLTEQYQIFAEELKSCWYKVGEGKLQVFCKEGNDYCLVCSEIMAQDNLKSSKIMEYIKSKNMSKTEQTYAQYVGIPESYPLFVTRFLTPTIKKMKELDTVEKGKEYLLVFVRNTLGIPLELTGMIPYLSTLVNTKEVQSIIFLPKEELAGSCLCSKLYWEKQEKNG